MKIFLALSVFLISCCSESRADGPSSFEAAGLIDAHIQFCAESYPHKADYYRKKILTAFSCGKSISEQENFISKIRESKNPQVRAPYQRYFDNFMKGMQPATKKQKEEFCEHFSEIKC
jgi:hypothetical protein